MASISRIYFIDASTGRELREHPYNGKSFHASSQTSITMADGTVLTAADFDCNIIQKRWFGPACPFNDTITLVEE